MSRMKIQQRTPVTPFISTIARDVDHLQESIQRMFENPFAPLGERMFPQALGWYPPVEVAETERELTLTAELPGMDQGDIKLEVEGDVLTLRGEKRSERVEEDTERQFYLEERTYGAFQRSFVLPPLVDAGRIAATFDKGVLTLRMPKNGEAKPRGREIPINATPATPPRPEK